MFRPNLKSVPLPVPEKIAVEFLGGSCELPNLGEEAAVGGWYRLKEHW